MRTPPGPALARRLRGLPRLSAILDEVRRGGRPAHLVGGLVRDLAAGARSLPEPLDVDLAVDGPAGPLAQALARRLRGTAFLLDEAAGIHRVAIRTPEGPLQVDVAQIQGGGILEDLGRRDFTVNAMAVPVQGPAGLLDPHGGLGDLGKGRLRPVSEAVFREDPLRMLRAFRLAARLGLTLTSAALTGIRTHRKRIAACAGERVRTELLGILSRPDSASWLALMDRWGLLTALFPELEPSRRCAEVYYGKGGVLKHSLEAVARMDLLLANLPRFYPRLGPAILRQLGAAHGGLARHQALLRLAVLLHDVSKPECARRMGGRLRFFGHEARGAEAAGALLERLRFSRDEIQMVQAAIFHHLRPGNLAAGGSVSDKAVYRFFRELGPHGVSLLLLCWADHASYLSPAALKSVLGSIRRDPNDFDEGARRRAGAKAKTLFHLQVVSYLLKKNFAHPEVVRPKKLLDGNQVMKALALPPGPRVGEILRALEEAQALGRVKTRPQALAFIRGL